MWKRPNKQCLFVASGLSSLEARSFLDFGDLVTLNRSLEFFEHVKLAIVGTRRKMLELDGQWHKAERVTLLFGQDEYAGEIPGTKARFARVEVTREPKGPTRFDAVAAHIAAGNVVGRGAASLVVLKRLGYSRVWLFGHDGGQSRLPGLGKVSARGYDKGRFCTEEMAKYLKLDYAFWPDRLE